VALAAVEHLIRLHLIGMMIRIELTQKYKIDLIKIKCKYENSEAVLGVNAYMSDALNAAPMKIISGWLIMAILVGCGSSGSVQKLGPDTYTVRSQVVFGPGKATEAQANALTVANNFCASQGKEVVVDSYNTMGHAMSVTGDSEVRFKCLVKGDADLRRPRFEAQPNLIIENRQR
jgi:hypothetical protein